MINLEPKYLQLDGNSLTTAHREELNKLAMPGVLSVSGFMASGQDVVEISKADAEILAKHNITYEQLGDRLDDVIARAKQLWRVFGHGKTAFIDGCIEVPPFLSTLGYQQCLFATSFFDTCGKGSSLIAIRNNNHPGEQLSQVTELHGHLIRDHHFCQGNTSFRVDPELAIKILCLQPGVSYTPKFKTLIEWRTEDSTNSIPTGLEDRVREAAIEEISVCDGKGSAILCTLEYNSFTNKFTPSDEKHLYVFIHETSSNSSLDPEIFGGKIDTEIGGYKGYTHCTLRECKEVELGPDDRLEK